MPNDATFELLADLQNKEQADISLISQPTYNIDDMDPKFCMVDLMFSGCYCLRSSKTIDPTRPGMVYIDGAATQAPLVPVMPMFGQLIGIHVRRYLCDYGRAYHIRYAGAYDTDGMEIPEFIFDLTTDVRQEPGTCWPEHDEVVLQAARESAVLLKNENHALPLGKGTAVNVFGSGSVVFHVGCLGAGKINPRYSIRVREGIERYSSLRPNEELYQFYTAEKDELPPADLLEQARALSDTAVVFIGRTSSEAHDTLPQKGGYYLTDNERALIAGVTSAFTKTVAILNVAHPIETGWIDEYNVDAVLLVGLPGMMGGRALAEILEGTVNPSGKLAFTIAKRYEDYPSARHFSWDKENEEGLLTYESYGLDAAENGSRGYVKSPVTVYHEDIYAGYRYFDTFAKEPLYSFGYGLSYTEFEIECLGAVKKQEGIEAEVRVRNTGERAGKEVVQLYLAACDSASECAMQELKGFEKTGLLQPGDEERICLMIPWREWSHYDEVRAAYIIRQGDYLILAGNSSRNTRTAAVVRVWQDIIVEQCTNRLGIRDCNKGKLEFLSRFGESGEEKQGGGLAVKILSAGVGHGGMKEKQRINKLDKEALEEDGLKEDEPEGNGMEENKHLPEIFINQADIRAAYMGDVLGRSPNAGDGDCIGAGSGSVCGSGSADKNEDRNSEKVTRLSVEQLAALCVGYGPGTPFAAFGDGSEPKTICDKDGMPLTTNNHPTGCDGYVSPAIEGEGIYSVFYKDGPAGIGETAWPAEMLMACAFNKNIWYEFGDAVGAECEKQQVDVWLAPAVNLHRHPLGGRSFEYFSEDPYLTGACACEIAKGVQENHPVLVCPKHFAVNEQETFRRGSGKKHYDAVDSILSGRAARELYLKPFEMLVKEADIACLMTSFNKINGVFAAGNADLCTHILREEWGYKGAAVTDWGDMDVVVDGADAVAAGNDIVMPGGPPVIAQILQGYKEGRVSREDLENAAARLLYMAEKVTKAPGN